MICRATTNDVNVLAEFAAMLWPERSVEDLAKKFVRMVTDDDDSVFFIAYSESGPVGFALVQLRYDYVEGTTTSPVAYLEGIYVKKDMRRRGFARELLKESEKWARLKECKEFASDCELHSKSNYQFHLHSGFEEKSRIICFSKKLL